MSGVRQRRPRQTPAALRSALVAEVRKAGEAGISCTARSLAGILGYKQTSPSLGTALIELVESGQITRRRRKKRGQRGGQFYYYPVAAPVGALATPEAPPAIEDRRDASPPRFPDGPETIGRGRTVLVLGEMIPDYRGETVKAFADTNEPLPGREPRASRASSMNYDGISIGVSTRRKGAP